ncbi:C39 family peptidase [Anaerotignum sp.]|uniref:C39 family peptidase n=1 Tax=Anaerotignum sp. TaxID=2039241 RepID=UPI00271534A4|nr:C39 family peptidase [Anaerotignum sp.]
MNKIIEIPFPIPFYTQRVTEESWKTDGFSDLQEGFSWNMRGCGIASLRMVIDGFLRQEGKLACEGQGAMIHKGLEQEAYKPGVGWIHQGLAKMAMEYGLLGTAHREKNVLDVGTEILAGNPCIISVSPRFAGGKPDENGNPYTKGGHLVVAYGCEFNEDGAPVAFLVHHPSCFLEYNWAAHWVPIEEFEASFSGNYIVFQKAEN